MAYFVKTSHFCESCGNEFEKQKGSRQKYCTPRCVRDVRNKQQNEMYAAKHPELQLTCAYCTNSFIQSRKGQKYCTTECFSKAKKIREKAYRERRKLSGNPTTEKKHSNDQLAKDLLEKIGKRAPAIERIYGGSGGYHVSV